MYVIRHIEFEMPRSMYTQDKNDALRLAANMQERNLLVRACELTADGRTLDLLTGQEADPLWADPATVKAEAPLQPFVKRARYVAFPNGAMEELNDHNAVSFVREKGQSTPDIVHVSLSPRTGVLSLEGDIWSDAKVHELATLKPRSERTWERIQAVMQASGFGLTSYSQANVLRWDA